MGRLVRVLVAVAVLAGACSSHQTSGPRPLLQSSMWAAASGDFPNKAVITSVAAGTGTEPWMAVGSVGGANEQPATACFLSPDGRAWSPCPLATVDGDGATTELLAVGRLGSTLVAGGVSFGPVHGNPRPTLWRMVPVGPLAEVRLPRELFGGERIISFNGVATGPLGGFAVGTWDGVTNQAVAQVWRTTDGADWQRLDGVTSMTSTSEELLRGSAVAVGPRRVVVVGAALHLHRLADGDDGAIWWSNDGRAWNRADVARARLTGPGNQELGVVIAAGDGFVAGGSDSGAAAVWWSPDGASWHRAALPASAGPHAHVTTLTSAPGRQWAAGVVDGAPRLWSSADGKHWTVEPLPAGTPQSGVQSLTIGAGNGQLLIVVQGPDGPRTWVASKVPNLSASGTSQSRVGPPNRN